MIHKVKGIGIVNKAEIDIFLELSCFFDDPEDVGNLISVSCAFSITMTAAMKLKDTYSWKESYDQPRQYIEKQRHYFVNKGPSSQFSCSVMSDSLRRHGLHYTRPPLPVHYQLPELTQTHVLRV